MWAGSKSLMALVFAKWSRNMTYKPCTRPTRHIAPLISPKGIIADVLKGMATPFLSCGFAASLLALRLSISRTRGTLVPYSLPIHVSISII